MYSGYILGYPNLVFFCEVTEHDNALASVLIDHLPEVVDCCFEGTLGGDESLGGLVALKDRHSHVYQVS